MTVNFSDITEVANKISELASNGVIVEGAECGDEGSDNEVRMESQEGAEECGLRESLGELGECVGDVNCGREGIGDEIGEAEKANDSSFLRIEAERGWVAMGA